MMNWNSTGMVFANEMNPVFFIFFLFFRIYTLFWHFKQRTIGTCGFDTATNISICTSIIELLCIQRKIYKIPLKDPKQNEIILIDDVNSNIIEDTSENVKFENSANLLVDQNITKIDQSIPLSECTESKKLWLLLIYMFIQMFSPSEFTTISYVIGFKNIKETTNLNVIQFLYTLNF